MSIPPMTDLQAALDEIPFASTSQQDAPAPRTSALLSPNPITPYRHTRTPTTPLPATIDTDKYNSFAATYNAWHDRVQRVGLKQAGLPPQLQYFEPRMGNPISHTPAPISIHSPPRPSSRFSLRNRDSFSPRTPHVHLPSSPSRPPQLCMTIPPVAPRP